MPASSNSALASGTVAESMVIDGNICFLSAVITSSFGAGPVLKNGSTSMIDINDVFCCKIADTTPMDSSENKAPMTKWS